MKDKILWIWEVWRPIRPFFFWLLGLTALSTAAALGYPLVLRALLDWLQERLKSGTVDEARFWNAIWALVGVGVVRWVANLYPASRAYLNARIDKLVRERLFQSILRKGYRFFLHFRTGDVITRLTDDIIEFPRIAWFCCSGLFRALDSGSKFVFCMGMMLWLHWPLALLSVAPLPAMILLFLAVQRKLALRFNAQRLAISATNDLLESSFSGIRILKAWSAEPRQGDALGRQLRERLEAEVGVLRLQQLVQSLHQSFNVVGQVVVILVGGLLVIRGELTAGTFYAFYAYLGMLAAPLLDLPNVFVFGRQAFVSIDRVAELEGWGLEAEGGALRGSRPLQRFESLELRQARFAYAEGQDVLRGVDLRLARGERVAVIGRLGSGKSTLLRLASGTLVPTGGSVQINGLPLGEYEARSFGRAVGVVAQESVLLQGSVEENLLVGRERDEALLRAVLEAVGLGSELRLDTDVGRLGQTLSGGQRQRLTMARALYGRPQVLLLDDLTSALDAENEDRLWRALALLAPGVTLLVVTHRLATARAMDRILVLDEGRVLAEGTHDQLMASSAFYREFQHDHARGNP